MTDVTTRSDALRRRAQAVFGGGSMFMYDLPDEANVVVERGAGARAWDADGRGWLRPPLSSRPPPGRPLPPVWTGRAKVLRFEGGLHGGNDYATHSTAPPRRSPYPRAIPDSDGIAAGTTP